MKKINKILFVIMESGAAQYLQPVFKNVIGKLDFDILISDVARKKSDLDAINPYCKTVDEVLEELNQYCFILSSATSSPIERKIIKKAVRLGINNSQFVDTWYNFKARFSVNGKVFFPNKILLMQNEHKNIAKREGIPAEKMVIVGHPAFELTFDNTSYSSNGSLVFIDQPIEKCYGQELGFTERQAFELLMETIHKFSLEFSSIHFLQHPAGSYLPSHEGVMISNDSSICFKSSVNVGMFSSIIVDSLIIEKKTICLIPCKKKVKLKQTLNVNALLYAFDMDDLHVALTNRNNRSASLEFDYLKGSLNRLTSFIFKEAASQ